jgi:nucleotide-binding universal stress UspA family protein
MLANEPVASIARRTSLPLFTVGHRLTNDPIRRILLPTDFSEHARDALAHAKALAHAYAASLDVLHVLERPQYVALNATDMLAMSDATLPERKARRRIETFLGTVNGSPVDTRIHVDHGDVADCIGHFADQHATDLVVLSTHGVIGQPTRPLGSVAEKVLRRIARPTFLTRAFGRSAAEPASSMSSDGAAGGTPRVDPKLS